MRRAQLSILVIVAVVLVIVGAFAFYLLSLTTPAPSTSAPVQTDSRTAARLCLEEAATQAIDQAMAQGGVNADYWLARGHVEQNETGSRTRSDYVEHGYPPLGEGAAFGHDYTPQGTEDAWAPQEYLDDGNGIPVRVWVQRGADYLDYATPDATTHPPQEQDFPLAASPADYRSAARLTAGPFIGILRAEPLCELAGGNRPNAIGDGSQSCLPGTYRLNPNPDLKSFQSAIEDRILATITDHNDTCGLHAPVRIVIGDDDVTAIAGNESVRVDVRLKRMYDLAYNIARLETVDPTFDLSSLDTCQSTAQRPCVPGCDDPASGGECLVSGLHVSVSTIDDPWEHLNASDADGFPWNGLLTAQPPVWEPLSDQWRQGATLVTITDTDVTADGAHPLFRFVIRNRYPIATTTAAAGDERAGNATFALGALDPDGTALAGACAPIDGTPVTAGPGTPLPNCTGAPHSLSFGYTFDPKAFCDAFPTTTQCPLAPTCTTGTSRTFEYVFCSVGPGGESVPADWEGLAMPSADFPRNCRLAYATASATCTYRVDTPTSSNPCCTWTCTGTDTCSPQGSWSVDQTDPSCSDATCP